MKRKNPLLAVVLLLSCQLFAQCPAVPVFPSCTGTETLVAANDNITNGQTRYFYGAAASASGVKLSGGTLVVCGDLTLNELVFDSGVIYVRPNAELIVNNASGLIVKGNTRVYNAGTFQCLGNYVMDGAWASAASPNIFVNVFSNSFFKMPNQYFVINNPYSWLVNKGIADFHGIITDPLAAAGSVCLGMNSQTRMRVLYNNAKNTYVSPDGPACVYVDIYSRFQDTLTNFPSINICLGNSHNSDVSCIPWGCKPNAWGAAQVTTGCTSCASVLTFLSIRFVAATAVARPGHNQLQWQLNTGTQGRFYIERATDGNRFMIIDSLEANGNGYYGFRDQTPPQHCLYRIRFKGSGQDIRSQVMQLRREDAGAIYPNPFIDHIVVPLASAFKNPAIAVTDAAGRRVREFSITREKETITISFDHVPSGIYLVTVTEGSERHIYKAIRK